MATQNREQQPDILRKIMALAIENKEFREQLTKNLDQAIDSRSSDLGFRSSDLSNTTMEVMRDIEESEINTLVTLYNKSMRAGIEPLQMF